MPIVNLNIDIDTCSEVAQKSQYKLSKFLKIYSKANLMNQISSHLLESDQGDGLFPSYHFE